MPVRQFSVVGAGAMGAGIAQVAAQAGCAVTVSDLNDEALGRGRAGVEASLDALVKRGKLADPGEVLGRIRWTTALEDHAGAELALEAVAENLEIKRGLFARLEAIAPGAVLATNTSSLSVTELGAGLQRPERLAGMHFFNPAPVMKLVEVVSGALTGADTEALVFEAAGAWGKTPVRVADVPGFIVNRVARPFYSEGLRAWSEGCRPEDVDAAMRLCAGFRMGPLELSDLIGQDVNWAAAQSVHAAYFGRTRFTPQLAQGRLVAAGRLGRKTGRGVYDYPLAQTADETPAGTLGVDWSEEFEEKGVAFRPADGRSASLHAAEAGAPVVLVDWRRDGSAAIAFSASGAEAMGAARGLAGEAGLRAIAFDDRPGGVVLRTLAQLANSAADALRDRVADGRSIDQAMLLGANYPVGPLAWADAVGAPYLVRVLDNIAAETGEEMYRPSEVLRRAAASGRKLLEIAE